MRIIILLIGLFCIAFGVALSTKSGLGNSSEYGIDTTSEMVLRAFNEWKKDRPLIRA